MVTVLRTQALAEAGTRDSELAKGKDRFEERARCSDGRSAGDKQDLA